HLSQPLIAVTFKHDASRRLIFCHCFVPIVFIPAMSYTVESAGWFRYSAHVESSCLLARRLLHPHSRNTNCQLANSSYHPDSLGYTDGVASLKNVEQVRAL